MAVFFKTPAPPGAVVHAEHLFVRRPTARRTVICAWGRGPDGRLARAWQAPSEPADRATEEPLPLALAS